MKTNRNPKLEISGQRAAAPRYALRKGLGAWELTFEGEHAVLKHEQGIYYVAYLLYNPPNQPIHGLALMLNVRSIYGKIHTVPQTIQQRSLGLDAAEAARNLRRKQHELEAILDDEDQIAPVRSEAFRELQHIYDYQEQNPPRIKTAAQKAPRAVRIAIHRFHQHLATDNDSQGGPNGPLRHFASHLEKYLLIPSARYSTSASHLSRAGIAGCFTYRPHRSRTTTPPLPAHDRLRPNTPPGTPPGKSPTIPSPD
jgi:hypothetical protein